MFDIPFYTSNNEYEGHCKLRKALLERRDEICCEENKFYGTGYSTIHTNPDIHKEYPDFNELLLQKQELFDPELRVTHCWVNVNPKAVSKCGIITPNVMLQEPIIYRFHLAILAIFISIILHTQ